MISYCADKPVFKPIRNVLTPKYLKTQGQISSYAIPSQNVLRYTYEPNLVILGTFFQKLLSGQARFGLILTIIGSNDLEYQGQMSPYAIPSENFHRYTYKPNLVILITFFLKLLCGQANFSPILTIFGPNDLEGQGQISP